MLIYSRVVAIGMTLLSAPILARGLGPEGRGETALAIGLLFTVPVFTSFGLHLTARRRAAADEVGGLSSILAFCIILFVPAALIAWFVVTVVGPRFDAPVKAVLFTGLLLAPCTVAWLAISGSLIGRGMFLRCALIEMAQSALYVVFVVALWIADQVSVVTVLASNISASVFTLFLALGIGRVQFRAARVSMRVLAKESFPFSFATSAQAASLRVDQIVGGVVSGSYALGIYSVAATVAALPVIIGQAVAAATFVTVARGEGADVVAQMARALRSCFALSVVVVLPATVLVPWIVPWLFGAEFSPAVPVAIVALCASTGAGCAVVLTSHLLARGHGVTLAIAQWSGVLVTALLILLLGGREGAMGIAVAAAVGVLTVLVIGLIDLRLPLRLIVPRGSDLRVGLGLMVHGMPEAPTSMTDLKVPGS